MPKVLLTQAQRDASHAENGDNALRVAVATRMMRDRVTQAHIAKAVGLAPVTLSRRLAKPEMFTIGELRRLKTALELTETEIRSCI